MTDIIDIDGLTPEQQQALLDQLKHRRDSATAEARARLELDRVLRRKLAEQGVKEGDGWMEPAHYECAYPTSWTVEHDGQQWLSTRTGAWGEPGESEDWAPVYGDEGDSEPDEDES